ncbi:PIG-L family deacetylase [Marisediminicola sp. LYQ134]|uniref:PIG-L family deacetylase n=1 Tax=Marisediminicola sp. LYQ134 TaxID=3391061 RepID=UPI0039831D8B
MQFSPADAEAATPTERVLFVHAHPDDESITTGGTIATLLDRGAVVTVLTCTRGENGEVIPDDIQFLLRDPEALARHREGELANAMRALGLTDHRWLGSANARTIGAAPRRYRDSGMVWGADGPEPPADVHPDALSIAPVGEVAADIATVIATTGARAVVSYDANGGYGHPDHVMAHVAAKRAAEVMSVPFYAIEPADALPGRAGVVEVDVSAALDRKVAALRAHRSQLTVGVGELTLSGGQPVPITSVESFRRDVPRSAFPSRWSEFALRGRILLSLAALVAGVVIGSLATVVHQFSPTVAGVAVPVGLVAGLLVVAALVAGLRIVFETRVVAGVAAAGILGVVAILSLESAGGSVLIPATDLSLWWVYGPVAIVAVVLAWPRLPQATRVGSSSTPHPKGPLIS